jgi:hypothetical protein
MGGASSSETPVVGSKPTAIQAHVPGKDPYPDEHMPREKLPEKLQKIVDDEDTLFDQLYDGKYVVLSF